MLKCFVVPLNSLISIYIVSFFVVLDEVSKSILKGIIPSLLVALNSLHMPLSISCRYYGFSQ